jgi:formate dehydrogenase alpha subunit
MSSERSVVTTCSFCGVGCTLEAHVLDGRILQITSPLDALANRGNLCVKGRFGFDYVTSPDRLRQPLIRRGGALETASWDEALDLVARRFQEIRTAHGTSALAGFSSAKCTNEENYLFQKFMRAVIGTHNVDHCSRLCHASSVTAVNMAIGSTAMSNSIGELRDEIDCLLVTGSNTTENHPIIALEMKAAIARGAKLILVDPREIELAQFATVWLRQRPGTDVAVFNGMAHVIIRDGLVNEAFVRERTEGLADLKAAVAPFTPEVVEAIAGVPAADLEQAAHLYATSPAAGIFWGMGISQHRNGTETSLTLCNLALLCGQIGRPGTGLNPLRGQNNVQGSGDMGCLPNMLPGYVSAAAEAALQRFESLWGVPLPREEGLTSTGVVAAVHAGRVHGLYVMGENPALTDPNLSHAREALEKLDFLVVQDIFLTETAAMADVVLPAAAWAEKEGTFTNTERRVQRVAPVLPPLSGAELDWRILCNLARRLGHDWPYTGPAEIFAEIRHAVPEYAGMTYGRIWERGLQWPCPTEEHPGTRFLFAESFPRGKGRLHAVPYLDAAELPDEQYPLVLTTGRVLYHWHGGVISRRSEGLNDICPDPSVEVHPEDAARLGISQGEMVRLSSRRGAVDVAAYLTTRSRPGTVFMNFHFAEAAVNLLTNDALDPYAQIPEFKVCAVKIEPLPP